MAKQISPLLTVGKGGVTAYPEPGTTCSGYIGHDWTKYTDETTVIVDSRELPAGDHIDLAFKGPMPGPFLPPLTVSPCFGQNTWWTDDGKYGNARSLDTVSADVYVLLYARAGARIYRGADAVAFAKSISGPQ